MNFQTNMQAHIHELSHTYPPMFVDDMHKNTENIYKCKCVQYVADTTSCVKTNARYEQAAKKRKSVDDNADKPASNKKVRVTKSAKQPKARAPRSKKTVDTKVCTILMSSRTDTDTHSFMQDADMHTCSCFHWGTCMPASILHT